MPLFLIAGFPSILEHHQPHVDLVPEGQGVPESVAEGRQEAARGSQQKDHHGSRRKG